ncbi:carbon-nitrogen family hydrolase [Salinibacillus xinjiangensis]|uniref:Carbon-nitrogen family hydrolase n=1 Tax=Salinibacillus xinjiangensis TaxID=1229268 RepID=A0A6G1XBP9_9BACI|nr:carbon-nitrogen family hydrolase [Salinibacillus xinjiangensis]MRG88367.1 carbon-nitrogen family hydrolase [Salinibacillus xinjiangensis]
MTLKAALIQMDIAYGDPQANYRKVKDLIAEAVQHEVDVVVLPELWTTGYDLTRLDEIADKEGLESLSFLKSLAQEHHVYIIGGSVAKRTQQGVTNTMFVISHTGELLSEYSKAHLFRLMDEEKYLIEGNHSGLFDLNNHKCAGLICYDIRFPEWIRTHMLNNTKVLFVVAEWPEPRIDHWRSLLISRAIENQCYVVACNRVGSDPKNNFGGHSLIIGPWGEIIAEADKDETILYGNIHLEQVDEVRKTIPIFSDRRPDIYKL